MQIAATIVALQILWHRRREQPTFARSGRTWSTPLTTKKDPHLCERRKDGAPAQAPRRAPATAENVLWAAWLLLSALILSTITARAEVCPRQNFSHFISGSIRFGNLNWPQIPPRLAMSRAHILHHRSRRPIMRLASQHPRLVVIPQLGV